MTAVICATKFSLVVKNNNGMMPKQLTINPHTGASCWFFCAKKRGNNRSCAKPNAILLLVNVHALSVPIQTNDATNETSKYQLPPNIYCAAST